MQADLYIIDESFVYNSTLAKENISSLIISLGEDLNFIRSNYGCDNTIFVNNSVYEIPFYKEFTISNLINDPENTRKEFGRDFYNSLISVIHKSKQTSFSKNEVIDGLLKEHSSELCHGVIVFNHIESIDEKLQIVIHTKNDWFKFRRHFLSLYPTNGEYFITECSKYFPKIFFHERNKASVNDILQDFSERIIYHLTALNDVLYSYKEREFDNESIKYQTLTAECKLDEDAASKDSYNSKDNLTFSFKNHDGNMEEVTCYPHLKLCKSDNIGDSRYYQNRIYFHEGRPNIYNYKILVGHIGSHL